MDNYGQVRSGIISLSQSAFNYSEKNIYTRHKCNKSEAKHEQMGHYAEHLWLQRE